MLDTSPGSSFIFESKNWFSKFSNLSRSLILLMFLETPIDKFDQTPVIWDVMSSQGDMLYSFQVPVGGSTLQLGLRCLPCLQVAFGKNTTFTWTFCYNDIVTVTVIQMTVTVIKVIVTPIDYSNYLDTLGNSQSIHSLCRKVCTKSDLAICCEHGLFLMGFFKGRRIRNGS